MQSARTVFFIGCFVLSAVAIVRAAEPADNQRPMSEWIEIVRREADMSYAKETPEFAAIRLAAGWTMPGLSGKSFQLSQVEKELPLLLRWLDDEGYDLLNRTLQEAALSADEEPYRPIVMGLYLRAGLDYAKTDRPEDRAFFLDLSRTAGGRDACLAFRDLVEQRGQSALYKGYLTGRLNRGEVDAIRLYRIAQGQRGVGESFLPMHLGLHPLGDGRLRASAGGGHGSNDVIARNHGQRYYDFRLQRLESVLRSETYTDVLDTSYHLTFSLRPEGVLEFLTYVEGYEPFQNDQGATVVRLKPELLELSPGENPVDSIRLKDRVGDKPVLLYINDPIDGPVTEQFPAFETVYQAYRNQVDCWFVAVDIHDWYYSGMDDMLSRESPGRHPNIHSYNQEERARKVKNRYLESPHATFPCLIGDDWQSVKNFYGTGGGANHWVIIDRAGVIAEYTGNQDGNLNHVETAIRRILSNNGLMAESSTAHIDWRNPDSAPNVVTPANKRMRLHAAEIVSVDAAARSLLVQRAGIGTSGTVQVRLTAHARVARDERPIELDDLQPGEIVAIDFNLDDYIDTATARETELPAPNYGNWRRQIQIDEQRLQMTLLGHYGTMRRRWHLDEAAQADPIPARGLRVLTDSQINNPISEPVVMWLSGEVTSIDNDSHTVRVRPAPINAETAKGYAFYQEILKQGRHVALTETARLRLAEVERWLQAPDADTTVLADDAVDYCLNGHFSGGFADLAIGDFVGVRYYPDRQPGNILVPHTIRISKPIVREQITPTVK